MKEYQENRFDLVGELHLVVSLGNGAEIGSEADGDVVRVHLGHAAVLRQVRQQGEQEGHHLMGITITNGHGNKSAVDETGVRNQKAPPGDSINVLDFRKTSKMEIKGI